jgi:hypothetical protein
MIHGADFGFLGGIFNAAVREQQCFPQNACHCEERSDVAIRSLFGNLLLGTRIATPSSGWFAMTWKYTLPAFGIGAVALIRHG